MCDLRDDALPIRQGDIFIHRQGDERATGLVITSDCDIAQKKAWRRLHWVPIVPLDSYAASWWAYDEVARLGEALSRTLSDALRKSREKRELPALSDEALRHWLETINEGVLLDPFELTEAAAIQRVLLSHAAAAKALESSRSWLSSTLPRYECWSEHLISTTFELVNQMRRAVNTNHRNETTIKDIKQRLIDHPGDVFILFGIPVSRKRGHVALLRFIREVGEENVGLQAGPAFEANCDYYRVAALVSPYRYDLTRRLGDVFGDIGLPQAYTEYKKTSSLALAEYLVGKQ